MRSVFLLFFAAAGLAAPPTLTVTPPGAKGGEVVTIVSSAPDTSFDVRGSAEVTRHGKKTVVVTMPASGGVVIVASAGKTAAPADTAVIVLGAGAAAPPPTKPVEPPPVTEPPPATDAKYSYLILRGDGPATKETEAAIALSGWQELKDAGHKVEAKTVSEAALKPGYTLPADNAKVPCVVTLQGSPSKVVRGPVPLPATNEGIKALAAWKPKAAAPATKPEEPEDE